MLNTLAFILYTEDKQCVQKGRDVYLERKGCWKPREIET